MANLRTLAIIGFLALLPGCEESGDAPLPANRIDSQARNDLPRCPNAPEGINRIQEIVSGCYFRSSSPAEIIEEFHIGGRWNYTRGGRAVVVQRGTWHIEGNFICVTKSFGGPHEFFVSGESRCRSINYSNSRFFWRHLNFSHLDSDANFQRFGLTME